MTDHIKFVTVKVIISEMNYQKSTTTKVIHNYRYNIILLSKAMVRFYFPLDLHVQEFSNVHYLYTKWKLLITTGHISGAGGDCALGVASLDPVNSNLSKGFHLLAATQVK